MSCKAAPPITRAGSNSQQIPVVNPPVNTDQGWIASPIARRFAGSKRGSGVLRTGCACRALTVAGVARCEPLQRGELGACART